MRDSRPQALDNFFDESDKDSMLQTIQQRAVALLRLNRAIRGILPAPMHPWCRVANFRQGILVIETANASWLMRLRYEQPALLSALRAQILPSLTSIDIRINPSLAGKQAEIAQENSTQANPGQYVVDRRLSEQSADTLREVAKRSPEKLRKAIERLASLAGESASKTSRNG